MERLKELVNFHSSTLKTRNFEWKLVFQPLSARVHVNLLEGNRWYCNSHLYYGDIWWYSAEDGEIIIWRSRLWKARVNWPKNPDGFSVPRCLRIRRGWWPAVCISMRIFTMRPGAGWIWRWDFYGFFISHLQDECMKSLIQTWVFRTSSRDISVHVSFLSMTWRWNPEKDDLISFPTWSTTEVELAS